MKYYLGDHMKNETKKRPIQREKHQKKRAKYYDINLPEGFQMKASLNLCPSISISKRIGTRLSAVGLQMRNINSQLESKIYVANS